MKSRIMFLILAVILGLSLWLRMDGIQWGLPHRLHPDEMKYVAAGAEVHGKLEIVVDEQGNQKVIERSAYNPKYFRNPPGFSYLNALWFPLWVQFYQPIQIEHFDVEPTVEDKTDITQVYYSIPWNLVHGARVLSVLLSAGTIVFIFLIALKLGGNQLAIIASLLNAVSFISIREAHFAVNDSCATFFVLLSFAMAYLAYIKESKKIMLVAEAISGLAVVCKYNMFPMVITIFMLWFLVLKRKKQFEWKQFLIDIFLMGLISVATFLIICPFPIIDAPTFWAEIQDLANKSARTWPGQEPVWSGFLFIESLYASEGLFACIFALIGIYFCIRNQQWILLVFPALYTLLVMSNQLYFMRFALPVLPFMNIVTAIAVISLAQYLIANSSRQKIVIIAITLIIIIQPFVKVIYSNHLFHQDNTRVQSLVWIKNQLVENQDFRIAVDQFCVPFPYRGPRTVGQDYFDHMVFYDSLPSDQLSRLMRLEGPGIEYIAISSFATFPGAHDSTYEERRQAVAQLAGSAKPELVFQPFEDVWIPQASDVEDTYQPVYDLMTRRYPGPVIELFKINK